MVLSAGLVQLMAMDWFPAVLVSPVGAAGAVPVVVAAVVAAEISAAGPGPAALMAWSCMRWVVPATSLGTVKEVVVAPEAQMPLQHHQLLSYEGRSR